MRIFRTTTLVLLVLFSIVTLAQESETSLDSTKSGNTNQQSDKDPKKPEQAKAQINQLLEGALLVRLQTKNKSITALREKGNDKLADKIEAEQRKYNLEIASAFKTLFDFCPVYFFYSDDSQKIRERQFDQVVFLSESLLPDTEIKLTKDYFLTAEFGTIEGENAFGALIIKDDQFKELERPFPYYVRTFESLPIVRRSVYKTVLMMNAKLHEFY